MNIHDLYPTDKHTDTHTRTHTDTQKLGFIAQWNKHIFWFAHESYQ